jgi:lipopolysaccharide transport system ATP-binding protein
VSDVITCSGIGKTYFGKRALGIKELLVGKHRRKDGSRFSRTWALRDVSFSVKAGAAFGVVGANGSGKSTLLSVLLGTLHPDTGTVRIAGRVASLLALGAGFHPELTGRQNVYLYGSILGMRVSDIRARLDAIVDFSEIRDAIDNPLRTYSSGMITRLGFATITHVDADVLLIDEVLAVGDMAFQTKCRAYLEGFKGRGTLVIVSHDLSSIAHFCDQGLWLDCGTVAFQGATTDVIARYRESVGSDQPIVA